MKTLVEIYNERAREIEKQPNIKFKKQDYLTGRILPRFAYHATHKIAADDILANGSKPYFSITGNKEEAIMYGFQRAKDRKQDAYVLQIDTKYINKDMLGDYYEFAGAPQYLELKERLPKEAFSLISIIPYKKIMIKEKGREKEIVKIFEIGGLKLNKISPMSYEIRSHLQIVLGVARKNFQNENKKLTFWGNRKQTTFTFTYKDTLIIICNSLNKTGIVEIYIESVFDT